ncbi:MAG: PIG-L family deacetylase, partial [Planctomycetota bacterium]|nr:PIG-L family deacetylase [Planctomycetota bacterium]
VILLAFGEHKAGVVAKTIEGPILETIPATFLQDHPSTQFAIDRAAAAELTRYKSPWVLGPIEWDDRLIRKAVIWLARKHDKPILKLTDEDYNEAGLQDLLAKHGQSYDLNIQVFRATQDTITGWPGGKPAQVKRPNDRRRTVDEIYPKRVIIFSPHPDDDVISMGGTLLRLVDQKHEVHVAYQTSGNIAVFDAAAIRFADFAREFNAMFGIAVEGAAKIEQHIEQFLKNKKPGQVDSEEVQRIKGLIRRGEARAAGRYCNIPQERLHFLDMPFYETGRVRKKPLGEADIHLIVELLDKVKPHQVYAAGDLSDPHGTHRVCLSAIIQALDRVKEQDWYKDCETWLYRGAWQEWGVEELDMAVPLSPHELLRKRNAIFKHESQKDKALFPGTDAREFWQRAEDRNRATAKVYDKLGLAEYEAIEGFVLYRGQKF